MTSKEKYRAYDAQILVDKFNNTYPVGSTVKHRTMATKSTPFTDRIVTRKAFLSHSNQAVAFFDGISGYCSIESDFVQYK